MASKGQNRGFGECEKCGKEILLASSYNQGVQLVWSSPEGSMSSIKMTPNDDRNFAFVREREQKYQQTSSITEHPCCIR